MAAGTLACAILSTLMLVVFPAVTKRVIDDVLGKNQPELLTPLILTAALAFVLQNGLNALRIIFNNTFEQRVISDLRSDLYSHIQMLPLRWFDNRATGDLMTRILEDVTSVERRLIDGIIGHADPRKDFQLLNVDRIVHVLSAHTVSSSWSRNDLAQVRRWMSIMPNA